ncbi:MAG: DtxR family transcriptional regulator [Ignavibacteriae bacterium]|nr:DtxR family transcriptional regulator [Ignavibacteriota bacterium]
MTDPVSALLIGTSILIAVGVVMWPRVGMLSRWQEMRRSSRRVLIEDALKHLYDCEYKRLVCTLQSLAGALGVSVNEVTELLSGLESHHLVRLDGGGLVLTEDGRSYALRVIRIHRLWERYLADETGVQELHWHSEAEQKEHVLTSAEADALSAQMGNPRFDPHGDPIPTSSGDLPSQRGVPMTQLRRGDVAQIVHIEDEPEVVYAQLVALGLTPGVTIRILDASAERIRFEADGVESVLAPIVAANVTAQFVQEESIAETVSETLDQLEIGQSARVINLSRRCRGQQRRRLMDLGVVPGTVISAEMRSASGDPTAYVVRGATIALRRAHAGLINIRREEKA